MRPQSVAEERALEDALLSIAGGQLSLFPRAQRLRAAAERAPELVWQEAYLIMRGFQRRGDTLFTPQLVEFLCEYLEDR